MANNSYFYNYYCYNVTNINLAFIVLSIKNFIVNYDKFKYQYKINVFI